MWLQQQWRRSQVILILIAGLFLFSVSHPAAAEIKNIGHDAAQSNTATKLKLRAHWIDRQTIVWDAVVQGATYTLHYSADADLVWNSHSIQGGGRIPLQLIESGLSQAQRNRFPHLAQYQALAVKEMLDADLSKLLIGQLLISASDAQGRILAVSGLQLPGVLDDLYAYEGPLGPTYHVDGNITDYKIELALWAPTARSVHLLKYENATSVEPSVSLPMTKEQASGVWHVQVPADWDRSFYRYQIDVFVPELQRFETSVVTDPYSVSLAVDSSMSQIVNLNDADLLPVNWQALKKPVIEAPEDIVIYELHVRDFSIQDESVPAELRGTYGAFTQSDSAGMRHLTSLAEAGLTHIHLLPAFDFATVPEQRDRQRTISIEELGQFPSDAIQQQAMLQAIKEEDGFNWGYDPWHYSVPEGSYAVEPNGAQRILEFRNMVTALNHTGLSVVMDVVYNHTTASGQDAKSVLDKIVPTYYHRLNADGEVETSTCCANTASEHVMMEKLLIDSITLWAKYYKVDGFRFDLMGHHSKDTMLKLRRTLDALTYEKDGVDGRRIYLYGEGWNFGEVADDARFVQATQKNLAGTGIGTFSDRLRDGARGGTPFSDPRDQGFINGLAYDETPYQKHQKNNQAELLRITDLIRIGMAADIADYEFQSANGRIVKAKDVDYRGQAAGYTADPQENISYVAAHDNETLFDINQMKLPVGTTMAERVQVQSLANALVLLGQGIPFIHAGQEFLRSKSMERDSFNAGDWFNAIDWTFENTNWGKGLPSAEKNENHWPLMVPLLSNTALKPTQKDMLQALADFKTLLRIRHSTPLFRLRTGEQIKRMVKFHNTGRMQMPGLIVMSIYDESGEVDQQIKRVVVMINARNEVVQWREKSLSGESLRLHPLMKNSDGERRDLATFDLDKDRFTMPKRSVSVFFEQRE